MRMRNKLAGLAAVGTSVVLVLAACSSDGGGGGDDVGSGFEDCETSPNDCNGGERAPGGEITWLLDNTIDGYFPMSAEAGSVYTLQAIWGILPYTGEWLPDGTYQHNMDLLAAEPEITSQDPFQTSWQIRPEAVWNDGTPITANDFIATFRMSAPPDAGLCEGCAPRAFDELVETIESTSPDGKSFTITYRDGITDPEWFGQFSAHSIAGGVVPSHLAEANGWSIDDPAELGEFFEWLHAAPPEFSGGPYMIQEMDLENQVVMVPNPAWYGQEAATLDTLVKRVNNESNTWVAAVQNAEIQGGNPSTWEEDVLRQLQDAPNVRTFAQPGPSWAHVDLNLNNEWLGEHQALRQAIFIAIPAQEIADRIFGALYPDVTVRTNHVFDSSSEYHVDQTTPVGQGTGDIERARQVLAEAGFEGMDGGPGALTYEGETVGPFRLRSGIGTELATSTQIQQDALGDIGIEVQIEPTEDLGATLAEADYDMMQFGWSGSPFFFNTGQQFWASDSDSNFGGYNNPDVDTLIEQEQRSGTLEESANLHNQMMEILVNDAYVLPLYDRPVFIFVTEDYIGVRDNTNSSLRGNSSSVGWGLAPQE